MILSKPINNTAYKLACINRVLNNADFPNDLHGKALRAHCCLYERTLASHPSYPDGLDGKHLLEVGCGLGGGLRWLRRLAFVTFYKYLFKDTFFKINSIPTFVQPEPIPSWKQFTASILIRHGPLQKAFLSAPDVPNIFHSKITDLICC